ncbi:mitogen-activated protein kinase kinase 9-like [Aristolochia californica]|uniref:mitogen-activated protein kinase kinase 9-like n=1 Tax=Aristolochia californica TaxID=171875 RepID=UPI0035E0E6D3
MAALRNRPNLKLHLPLPLPAFPSLPPLPPTFNPSPHITSFADLETLSVLGYGTGGTVYKVRHRVTSALYALKMIQLSSSSDDFHRRQISCEMEILSLVDSPHVVGCHGIFKKDPNSPDLDVAFVLEHMDVGSLDSLLRQSGTGNFSEDIIAKVASHVLRGLSYLHGHKIVHRDIKPANLLVNSKMEVKIADFGVSKIVNDGGLRRCSSYVGTHGYMSPERFDPGSHGGCYDGFAGDVWSLGITLWELYVGYFPLLPSGQRPDWATLMYAICFGEIPDFPDSASHQFRDFLSCCLHKDWSQRATVSDLLSHPFVTGEPPAAQVH